jgi:hypothetical protein
MGDRYRIIATQAKRLLAGGDPSDDNTWDIRELELLAKQVHASFIKNNYFENLQAEGVHGVSGAYVVAFPNVAILEDKDRCEKYSLLPEQYVNLPGDKGVHGVSSMKNQRKGYIPVRNGDIAMLSGLRSGGLQGNVGFYAEGDRIYYYDPCNKLKEPKAMIKLVTPKGNTTPEQELAILAEIMKMVQARRPQDKINDSNPGV